MKITLTSTLLFCYLLSLVTLTAQQPVLITQEKNLGTISHITYSPNGRYIASINEKDFLIKVWDVQSSKLIGTLVGHSASIKEVVFNASGDGLFSYDANSKKNLTFLSLLLTTSTTQQTNTVIHHVVSWARYGTKKSIMCHVICTKVHPVKVQVSLNCHPCPVLPPTLEAQTPTSIMTEKEEQ